MVGLGVCRGDTKRIFLLAAPLEAGQYLRRDPGPPTNAHEYLSDDGCSMMPERISASHGVLGFMHNVLRTT